MASESKGEVERTVHLVSQEGEQFDVSLGIFILNICGYGLTFVFPLDIAKMSELVKTMFDGK